MIKKSNKKYAKVCGCDEYGREAWIMVENDKKSGKISVLSSEEGGEMCIRDRFMGPFVMMELDFRNVGIQILQQVMKVIHEFHTDINSDNLLLLSTITSLDEEATHIMSLSLIHI